MGLFAKLKKNYQEAVERSRSFDLKENGERATDPTRPSIESLPFTKLDPSAADDPELQNVRVKDEQDKAKFIECIRQGRAEFSEVMVVDSADISVEMSRDHLKQENQYIYRRYVKVADLSGRVRKDMVACLKDIDLKGWYNGKFWEQAQNPEVVSGPEYKHIFILHYFLGEKEYYMAMEKEALEHPATVADEVAFDKKSCLLPVTENRCYW